MRDRVLVLACGLFAWWSAAHPASALPLTLSTPTTTVALGTSFAVQVAVPTVAAGEDVRGFDLRFRFDPQVLGVPGGAVTFGSQLGVPCASGDPSPACQARARTVPGTGVLRLVESSLLSDLSSQSSAPLLATITFTAAAPGTSTIQLSPTVFTRFAIEGPGGALRREAVDAPLPSLVITVPTPPPQVCNCVIKKIQTPGGKVVGKLNNTSPGQVGDGSVRERHVKVVLEAVGDQPGDCPVGELRTLSVDVRDDQGDAVVGTPVSMNVFCPAGDEVVQQVDLVYTHTNCAGGDGPAPGEPREFGDITVQVSTGDDFLFETRRLECRPSN